MGQPKSPYQQVSKLGGLPQVLVTFGRCTLHSILIARYYLIMHLVAKIFSHAQNHASSMTTGISTKKIRLL
ncbi:MAG: hypothetical protein ACI9LM_001575 [Alteromonadaceae bacterium]|jgi:hypothetical protein